MINEKIELSCGAEVLLMQGGPGMVAVIYVSDTKGRTPQEFAQINNQRIAVVIDPKDFEKLKQLINKLDPKPLSFLDRIFNWRQS